MLRDDYALFVWRKAVIFDDKSLTKFLNRRPDLGLYDHIGRSLCVRGGWDQNPAARTSRVESTAWRKG
eukprot:5402530-Pleurochrysis_carterae.AAC.1